jgi:hypothetical protein
MPGAEPEKWHKSTIGSGGEVLAMSADVIAGGGIGRFACAEVLLASLMPQGAGEAIEVSAVAESALALWCASPALRRVVLWHRRSPM